MGYKKKLIEAALPLDAISAASAREKSIRHGHPSTLHLWWARRPLAAARAVLWASLVDDPSAHPDRFPTEEDQKLARKRLFGILERLVVWENSNDFSTLDEARQEIDKSQQREREREREREQIRVLDPFSGGGAIPLEAQRLGLEAHGGDLNPVAVLISKALVEIPPRFAGLPPVNPKSRARFGASTAGKRAQGLAEDIGFYGQWMRDQAFERIGHLYPKAALPAAQGGNKAAVIAWIWARTVRSPDPSWGEHVPLVRSWVLRRASKNKLTVWVEPVVNRSTRTVSYQIRDGGTPPAGTVKRQGGTCLATGVPIRFNYIREQGRQGLLNQQLIAIVVEGHRGRTYLVPDPQPPTPDPQWSPRVPLPERTLGFRVQQYGMTEWADLFTERQLVALSTFSNLLSEVRPVVEEHALATGLVADGIRLRDGGSGAAAYADAVVTYLAFVVDRCVDKWASVVIWNSTGEKVEHVFGRQAIPMVWDYAEGNPFSSSTGNWSGQVAWVWKAVAAAPVGKPGEVSQREAAARLNEVPSPVVCTDPPYYDNISYADLSDFFFVWLRRNLSDVWPDECATLLTPKADELIANPYRAGSKQAAQTHFEDGMAQVLERIADVQHPEYPATIFYAYKQQETKQGNTASTGWETFLQALVDAGLQVTATWPIRTERPGRMISIGTAALASSVVIACRPRPADAPMATRRDLLQELSVHLPKAVRLLQEEAIAPVDMAQSVIGPGMEVFSRYSKVLEADGKVMKVRTALTLINERLEEVLSAEETEFDADTRWALTWYRQYGHQPGPFGDAETLSKAKNTSVSGVVQAGIVESRRGEVRLLTRADLDQIEWNPAADKRPTVWEVTQHLIVRLGYSESEAAGLLRQVGGDAGDRARRLAYLLYQIADRKGRKADAAEYNGLIRAWHDIARQASAPLAEEQRFGL